MIHLPRCPSPHNGFTVNVTLPEEYATNETQIFRRSKDTRDTILKLVKEEGQNPFNLSVTYAKTHKNKPLWEVSVKRVQLNTLRHALFGAKELYVIAETDKIFNVSIVTDQGRTQHTVFTPLEGLIDAALKGKRKPWAVCYSNTEALAVYSATEIILANVDNAAWQKLNVLAQSSNDLDPKHQAIQLQIPGKKDPVDLNFRLEGNEKHMWPTDVFFDSRAFKVV